MKTPLHPGAFMLQMKQDHLRQAARTKRKKWLDRAWNVSWLACTINLVTHSPLHPWGGWAYALIGLMAARIIVAFRRQTWLARRSTPQFCACATGGAGRRRGASSHSCCCLLPLSLSPGGPMPRQSEWKSPWEDFRNRRNGPTFRPLDAYTIDVFRIPDCDFRSPDYHELTDWYWRVSLKGMPINGGLTTGPHTGKSAATTAIHVFEWIEFREQHYWDVETGSWCRRGELPR